MFELKKWSEVDFASIGDIFTHCNRSYLSDGLPLPYTAKHAQEWYESTVRERDEKQGLYRIICVDGIPAGVITLSCGTDVCARDADLSYILLDAYSGRGVMTEAVNMICAQGFETLDILRISAQVFSPNAASRRILEKNGFDQEGVLRRAVCKGAEVYDMCLYGKLK